MTTAAIGLIIALLLAIYSKLENLMSVVTDAVASVEAALAKASTDLQTLATNAASQATAITALQQQLANAGLSQTDTDALAKLVTDANAFAANADAVANPPAPAPVAQPAPAAS